MHSDKIILGSASGYRTTWNLIRISRPNWKLVWIGGLVLMMEAAASLAFPLVTRQLIDGFSATSFSATSLWTNPSLWQLVGVLVAGALAAAVGKYLLSKAGLAMTATFKKVLVESLLDKPVAYFDHSLTGGHVSRVNNDTGAIARLVSDAAPNLLGGVILLIGSAIILFFLDVRLAAALFGIILSSALLMAPAIAKISKITFDQNESISRLASQLTQLFSNIRLVKSYTAENIENIHAAKEIDKLYRFSLYSSKTQAMLHPIINLAMTFALVSIFLYGGILLVSGTLSVGTLTAFILYIFNVIAPIMQLSAFFVQLQAAKGASVALAGILDATSEYSQGVIPKTALGTALQPANADITLIDVDFAYQAGRPVLQVEHLTIQGGKRTALIGPSGSGKTTLLALLERFASPQSGQIQYGGIDIGLLPLAEWRQRIGYVPQNAALFSGTVRENILYGGNKPVSEKSLRQAALAANCLEFVERLGQGFETVVGENGALLSGGQKQRLAIARMFMRDPEILLLDEATSNLDGDSEELVLAALENLMEDRTVLLVTHRLAMMDKMNHIVIIDSGRVVALGNHASLIEQNSYYRRMNSNR